MRKRELIGRIARRTTLSEQAVSEVLRGLRDELVQALAEGQVVALDGLGRFRVARQLRSAPCPLTGTTGHHAYVTFRAARRLKVELDQARSAVEAEIDRVADLLARSPALLGRLSSSTPRR